MTPVLALLDGVSVIEGLCAAPCEVPHIFDLPLETLLNPELDSKEILVPFGSEDWLYKAEVIVVRCVCASPFLHFSLPFVYTDSSKMSRRNFTDASYLRSTYRTHHFWSADSTVNGARTDIPVRLLISLSFPAIGWLISYRLN